MEEQKLGYIYVFGSDFDGFIDPINSCKTVEGYSEFENELIDDLEEMVNEAKQANPLIDYFITDIRQQNRDVIYYNGRRFLEKNFKRLSKNGRIK